MLCREQVLRYSYPVQALMPVRPAPSCLHLFDHCIVSRAMAHPSVALLRHLARTVPALLSVLMTSSTMEPSAMSTCEPGLRSTASFL